MPPTLSTRMPNPSVRHAVAAGEPRRGRGLLFELRALPVVALQAQHVQENPHAVEPQQEHRDHDVQQQHEALEPVPRDPKVDGVPVAAQLGAEAPRPRPAARLGADEGLLNYIPFN